MGAIVAQGDTVSNLVEKWLQSKLVTPRHYYELCMKTFAGIISVSLYIAPLFKTLQQRYRRRLVIKNWMVRTWNTVAIVITKIENSAKTAL